MYKEFVSLVKELYPAMDIVPLHTPVMGSLEKDYLSKCVDSTFVSSVGQFVNQFEDQVCEYTGAQYAVAVVNGTAALHASLVILGVDSLCEVLTQALTFVATANAIFYCGAKPIFIDSAEDNLGLCPEKLEDFLRKNSEIDHHGYCVNKVTKKRIAACIPMHVFGHPVKTERIIEVCSKYNIAVIEDAAEAFGSFENGEHLGLKGDLGIFSFNGNKIITCGGGGVIVTNNFDLAKKLHHITKTAKKAHSYEFIHDMVGFNYRLPNLNAAFACAQMDRLDQIVENKRETACIYRDFFKDHETPFIVEKKGEKVNYWLNAIKLSSVEKRDKFLDYTNKNGVMTRPVWRLLNKLDMYKNCQCSNLDNADQYEQRIVNIPSSYRDKRA